MSQENLEVAQRFVERFNAGEFAWDQLDPGVVWVIDPPAFLAGTYHGHDGVRTLLGRFTEIFDEARYEVDELLKLRDGKLVAYRAYFDREQALEAVGLRE